ncbi:hypothetical protein JHK82_055633 [Glycine max]|nr:hypothetical protein JHK85_056471 [Glycine max]KAG5076938.1 hypothetical protein JHK82_055633 [Glycine max]
MTSVANKRRLKEIFVIAKSMIIEDKVNSRLADLAVLTHPSLHYREAPLKRGAGTLGPISDGVLWKYINAFVLQTTKRIVPFQFVRGDRVILVSPPLRIA